MPSVILIVAVIQVDRLLIISVLEAQKGLEISVHSHTVVRLVFGRHFESFDGDIVFFELFHLRLRLIRL